MQEPFGESLSHGHMSSVKGYLGNICTQRELWHMEELINLTSRTQLRAPVRSLSLEPEYVTFSLKANTYQHNTTFEGTQSTESVPKVQ